MKEGWQMKRIGEIAHHSLGKMLDKAKNKGEPRPYLRNLSVRWFEFDLSDVSEMRFIPEESLKYTAVKGDVLVCEGGYPGRAAIWSSDEPIHFQKALHRVRFHEPERNKWFLYYLDARDLDGTLKGQFSGAGIQHFTGEALARFELPLPSVLEQQRIVGILDEAFDGIAAAEANAKSNLQNARALSERHLQSVFSKLDVNCTTRSLAEVSIDFGRGKSKHRPRNDPKLYDGKYPFIQTGDVRNSNHLITSYSQTYNAIGLAQSKLWPKNTLCITIAANIAETGILNFDACFPDSIIGVVVNEKYTSTKFLEYLLQSFKTRLQAQGKGSAQDNINLGTFENQAFPFPDLPTQDDIVRTLNTLDVETNRLAALLPTQTRRPRRPEKILLAPSLFRATFLTAPPAMANEDIRWRQRLQSFRRAFARLSAAADLSRQRGLSDLERQELIQAFEFTFELGWLTLKDYLEALGFTELRGPKPVVRAAFANGVIAEGEEWIAMIESRNRTSRSYNEDTAREIATAILAEYVPALAAFLARFTRFEEGES